MIDRIIYLIKQDIDKQCELRVGCDDDCPYKGDYDTPCYCKNVEEFDWNNYLLKKVKKINNWISVKDRLPEFSGNVLVCYRTGERFCNFMRNEVCYYADGKFTRSDGCIIYTTVTHWQPLPEPPKEREEI